MGNYHPSSMKIGTQTKKHILSPKFTKAEVTNRFREGRRRHVGNSSECYQMGNYHPISMKIGTQTKQNMLRSKVIIAVAYDKKQKKLIVKNDIVLKRQPCMSAQLQNSKNFLFAGRSFHTHTTGG
jgi:hypothetical protein